MFNQRVNALHEVKDSLFNKVWKCADSHLFPFRQKCSHFAKQPRRKCSQSQRSCGLWPERWRTGVFFFITFFFAPEVKEPLSPRRQVLSRTQEGEEEKKKSEKKLISLTRLALQKTRMSKAQKKTAMTPVPIRITISTLALSLEPRHNERRQRRQLITL